MNHIINKKWIFNILYYTNWKILGIILERIKTVQYFQQLCSSIYIYNVGLFVDW